MLRRGNNSDWLPSYMKIFEYVDHAQYEDQLLAVIREHPEAIQYVKHVTERMVIMAIETSKDIGLAKYASEVTESIRIAIVTIKPFHIIHVDHPSETVMMAAIMVSPDVICVLHKYASDRCYELALSLDESVGRFIHNPSKRIAKLLKPSYESVPLRPSYEYGSG